MGVEADRDPADQSLKALRISGPSETLREFALKIMDAMDGEKDATIVVGGVKFMMNAVEDHDN